MPNNSVSKEGYVQKEIKKILDVADEKPDGEIFIIPLRLDDCQIPNRFRYWQHEDNFPKEKQGKTFQRLAKSLKLRAASLGIDTPFSELNADGNDNLLPQAILLVKRFDGISVYRLQRYLRIGYTRASNLIEKLIELGIIFEKMVGIISARQNKSPLFIKNRMPSRHPIFCFTSLTLLALPRLHFHPVSSRLAGLREQRAIYPILSVPLQ